MLAAPAFGFQGMAQLQSLFSGADQWLSHSATGNWSLCSPSTFVNLNVSETHILDLTASVQENFTYVPPWYAPAPYSEPVPNLSFCNITVSYTHPGWNDTIVTSIFLPTNNWNGRYQAHGGAGLATGGSGTIFLSLITGLKQGFAVSTTDGGHTSDLIELSGTTMPWALSSPGKVNWPVLLDFSSLALHEMAVMAKNTITAFYKESTKYSYWFGGSQGGRQGHMYAQQYPEDFNGIVALFPAITWSQLMAQIAWGSFVMDKEGVYPPTCETSAITQAAILACDPLDGVEDGIISRLDLCKFDAHSVINKEIDCEGKPSKISKGAATVAQAVWDGPRSANGSFVWYGYPRGSDISGMEGPAATMCTKNEGTGITTCDPAPMAIGQVWFRYYVQNDADSNIRKITQEQWDNLLRVSIKEYEAVIGTSSPDLSGFKRAGGKLITWHGLADSMVSVNNTVEHFDRVAALDPQVHDYYRLFLAPGIGHDFAGPLPVVDINSYIVDWVEKGIEPETLKQKGVDPKGNPLERGLCSYPKVQHYVGGDSTKAEAFICV